MMNSNNNKTHCGWITINNEEKWLLEDCGEPGRISHTELKEKGLSFRDDFLNKEPKNDSEKTAKHKYNVASNTPKFVFESKFKTIKQKTRLKASYDHNGKDGSVVFTGQPGGRYEPGNVPRNYKGKFYEFVFFEPNNDPIILDDNTVKYFKFVYRDQDKQNISSDWKYWKAILKAGGKMPVFFKKKNGTILHFGLSYL